MHSYVVKYTILYVLNIFKEKYHAIIFYFCVKQFQTYLLAFLL